MGTVESKTLFHQRDQTTPRTWKHKKKKKKKKKKTNPNFQTSQGLPGSSWGEKLLFVLFFFPFFFFFFFNTAALIQITWTTGVVCESPVFLRSVYCSHLVCGCVIESGPCLNKRQMWTQISCLLLYVIDGNASSCRSAAVRPPPLCGDDAVWTAVRRVWLKPFSRLQLQD